MTVSEKLQQIQAVKAQLKTAIEYMGVSTEGVPFEGYPGLISQIESGSSGVDEFYKKLVERDFAGGQVVFPNYFTTIPVNCLRDYSELQSVSAPNVTSIGDFAFDNCGGLTSIDIPNVTSIGGYAFQNCYGLTSIDLQSVTSVDAGAFQSCVNITSINLPNVTEIRDQVFYYCNSLSWINLPSVTSIGDSAFDNCSNLSSIDLSNVTSIGGYAFYNCNTLSYIHLPNVTSIGVQAFYNCNSLTTIIGLHNVTSIGAYAFWSCYGLTSIDLPNVTSIGDYAFEDCPQLVSITLGSSTMVTLDNYLGNGLASLQHIYVPADLVDVYKADSVWSQYADYITAIDDEPEQPEEPEEPEEPTEIFHWYNLNNEESYEPSVGTVSAPADAMNVQMIEGSDQPSLTMKVYTKVDSTTGHIVITPTRPFQVGDVITFTAYRYKNTNANGALSLAFDNGSGTHVGTAPMFYNSHPDLPEYEERGIETQSYTITEANAGATSFTMYRPTGYASTNVYISKLTITSQPNVDPEEPEQQEPNVVITANNVSGDWVDVNWTADNETGEHYESSNLTTEWITYLPEGTWHITAENDDYYGEADIVVSPWGGGESVLVSLKPESEYAEVTVHAVNEDGENVGEYFAWDFSNDAQDFGYGPEDVHPVVLKKNVTTHVIADNPDFHGEGDIEATENGEEFNITVEEKPRVMVTGTVTYPEGDPAPNIEVQFNENGYVSSASTNDEGQYEIDLALGDYQVAISSDTGYDEFYITVTEEDNTFDFALKLHDVWGRITVDGEPVANTEIVLEGWFRTNTDDDGNYRVTTNWQFPVTKPISFTWNGQEYYDEYDIPENGEVNIAL